MNVPCPFCSQMDELLAPCRFCNDTGQVPAEVAQQCLNPGCDEPIFKKGPMCEKHGCHKCGGIILADTEDFDKPMCDECYVN